MATTTTVPKNLYHKRHVADAAAKQCDICYRPSTCVLITPDQNDWFYICPGHLKDRGFCSPAGEERKVKAKVEAEGQGGEGDAEKEKREKLEKEKEEIRLQVIREYEEKLAKKGKEKGKDKDKKEEDKKEGDKKEDKKDGKDKDKEEDEKKEEEEPRIFVLHKKIFDRRVLLKRQAIAAKRNLERMKNPGFWPSVPSGLP
ncbi:VPS4-associated protein 1 [Tricharina praecox]|uniref:VPS4-associated protein 1 n=1 Tax=Tricharina praecox TaxID=43433 RepID=UPI00221F8DA8|nr:VPS4-associated protein 1 [Tricharina praecox]KAI5857179.1 VPS4-associated protein 1 [Tricharina praecox]